MGTNEVVSKRQKAGKIASYVINVISVIIMLFSVFIVVTFLTSKDNDYPVYFGRAYCTVLSDSMKQDYGVDGQPQKWDQFSQGDVICFRVISGEEKQNLEVGTVITFWDNNIGPTKVLNTHRIYEIRQNEVTGEREYSTKGDNNIGYDRDQASQQIWRKASEIQGVYVGKATGIGNVLLFLQSKTGFAVLIVVPCVLIMLYCGVLVVMNLIKYTKQKAVMQHEDDVEALRAQMKAELLKEMQEKNNAAQAATEDNKKEEATDEEKSEE